MTDKPEPMTSREQYSHLQKLKSLQSVTRLEYVRDLERQHEKALDQLDEMAADVRQAKAEFEAARKKQNQWLSGLAMQRLDAGIRMLDATLARYEGREG